MSTESRHTIDNLIEKLRTKEGRAIATVRAIESGININANLVLQAIKYFASIGDYVRVMKLPNNIPEAEILLLYFDPKAAAFLATYKIHNSMRFEQNRLNEYLDDMLDSLSGVSFEEGNLRVAMKYIELAKRWESEKKIGAANYRYKNAFKFLMLANDFINAYDLANRRGFVELANEAYTRGIRVLEKIGKLDEAGALENFRGNKKRAQIYLTLDTALRQA